MWGQLLGTFIGAAGSLYGAGLQADASEEAMDVATQAQQMGTDSMLRMFEEGMALSDPYRAVGAEAAELYGQPDMGITESDLYAIQQGEESLRAGQSARGRRKSGSSARELSDFYGNVFSDIYNRDYQQMLDRANIGAQFAGAGGQAGQQLGGDLASTYLAGAQQQIPYILGQGQMGATQTAVGANLLGNLFNYGYGAPDSPQLGVGSSPNPVDSYGVAPDVGIG
jgi:hypothetical protein